MSEITSSDYWSEISSIAESLATDAVNACDGDKDDALDKINDYMLHETVDGHQWVIYNAYNADVMRHSDNEDYYIDNFGTDDAGHVLKESGLSGLHNVIAFWCMYADVQDRLDDALDDAVEKWEEEHKDDTPDDA
jgi:hypothetical protein